MICMQHPQNQAAAICPGCGAGICQECACRVADGNIWSCCELNCQERITNNHEVNKKVYKIYRIGKYNKKRISWVGLYFISMGLVLLFFSTIDFVDKRFMSLDQISNPTNLFMLLMGLIFLSTGFYHGFSRNRLSL